MPLTLQDTRLSIFKTSYKLKQSQSSLNQKYNLLVVQFFGFIIVQVGEHSRASFRLKQIAKYGMTKFV